MVYDAMCYNNVFGEIWTELFYDAPATCRTHTVNAFICIQMHGLSVLYIVGGTNAVGIRNNNWQSIIISMKRKFWEIRYLMDVLLRSRQRRGGGVDSTRLIANINLVLNYSEENIYIKA